MFGFEFEHGSRKGVCHSLSIPPSPPELAVRERAPQTWGFRSTECPWGCLEELWRLYSKELWAKPWQFPSFCPLVSHLGRIPAGVLNKHCLSVKNGERPELVHSGVPASWRTATELKRWLHRGWCGQYVCCWRWHLSSDRDERMGPVTLWYGWTCYGFHSSTLSTSVNHLCEVQCWFRKESTSGFTLSPGDGCASPPFLADF